MAKKKDTTSLILNGAVVLFGLLLILPIFISLVNGVASSELVGQSTTTGYALFDLADFFSTEALQGISTTAVIFSCVAIFGGLGLAVVALLRMIGLKLPRIIMRVLGIVVAVATVVAFILLIVLINEAAALDVGIFLTAEYVLGAGAYLLLIFGLLESVCAVTAK